MGEMIPKINGGKPMRKKRNFIICVVCCMMMGLLTACSSEFGSGSRRIVIDMGNNALELTNVRFFDFISYNFINDTTGNALVIGNSFNNYEMTFILNLNGNTYTAKLSEIPSNNPSSFIVYTNSTSTEGDYYSRID